MNKSSAPLPASPEIPNSKFQIPKKMEQFYWGLFLIYVILVLIRCPEIVLEGRFWAEEGKYYFTKAVEMGFWEALVSPQMGYYSLVPNVAALIAAKWVPLEFAPKVTVFFALLVQLIPAWLILFTRIDFLKSIKMKALALGLVLFTLPNQQIWLNTISSHFFLCLCTGLILVSKTEDLFSAFPKAENEEVASLPSLAMTNKWKNIFASLARNDSLKEWVKLGILGIAGLTGVVSVFLTPFFWCKAVIEKSKTRFLQAGILTLCAAVQGGFILSNLGESRSLGFYGDVWINALFSKMVLLPLTGVTTTGLLCNTLRENLENGGLLWMIPIGLFLYWGFLIALIWKSKMDSARYLFLTALFVICLSLLGAYESGTREGMIIHVTAIFCGRYYYAPNVFMGLAFLATASPKSRLSQKIRYFLMGLVVWFVLVGAFDYFWLTQNYFSHGARWSKEVRTWKENTKHKLQFWPDDPWWSMRLRGKKDEN